MLDRSSATFNVNSSTGNGYATLIIFTLILATARLFLVNVKKLFIITFFLLSLLSATGQVIFRTIVTSRPVIVGEPFQVQYVMEEVDKTDEFFPPVFEGLQRVSGPYEYAGSHDGNDGPRKLRNVVFTLVANKPGRYVVPAADARIGGVLAKSEKTTIEVITRADATRRGLLTGSAATAGKFFLHPGEDPQQKVRQNIFMKILVDRKTCYVGQPVTATFKLYSRLHSKSDIVKNPGFYGFTVHDMIDVNDRMKEVESVDGKLFDVHTIRKVQLYPLRAGDFVIDAMEVHNRVEFSRSTVDGKIETEITEGVVPGRDEATDPDAMIVENTMESERVSIRVKPMPEERQPADFTGAVGAFRVKASTNKQEYARNEEGDFFLTISGKGNFSQLAAPSIQWPAGIDAFDPEIRDTFTVEHTPLQGERIFRYKFITKKPGDQVLPAVVFSFFDPDSNRYRTVTSSEIKLSVNTRQAAVEKAGAADPAMAADPRERIPRWILPSALAAILVIVAWRRFLYRPARTRESTTPVITETRPDVFAGLAEDLRPATILSEGEDVVFFSALRKGTWHFLSNNFQITGSNMNKRNLASVLTARGIDNNTVTELISILDRCEAGTYTGAESDIDKSALLEETRTVLKKIAGKIHSEYL